MRLRGLNSTCWSTAWSERELLSFMAALSSTPRAERKRVISGACPEAQPEASAAPHKQKRTVYIARLQSASACCITGAASTREKSAAARATASGPDANRRELRTATSAGGRPPSGTLSRACGSSSSWGVVAARSMQPTQEMPSKLTLLEPFGGVGVGDRGRWWWADARAATRPGLAFCQEAAGSELCDDAGAPNAGSPARTAAVGHDRPVGAAVGPHNGPGGHGAKGRRARSDQLDRGILAAGRRRHQRLARRRAGALADVPYGGAGREERARVEAREAGDPRWGAAQVGGGWGGGRSGRQLGGTGRGHDEESDARPHPGHQGRPGGTIGWPLRPEQVPRKASFALMAPEKDCLFRNMPIDLRSQQFCMLHQN
jgi:hypothetical protein